MRRVIGATAQCLMAAALLAAALPAAATGPQRPLVMGILPFMSPIALIKRFAPLRDYLSRELHRPVVIETAKDFPQFLNRTAQGRYDILYTAPHFVPIALDTGAYRLQATYVRPLSAIILVRKDSPIRAVSALAGKVVATPPPEAIITIAGRKMLERAGLSGARTPLYRNYRSHTAAYEAVAGGEASAAIVAVNVVHAPEAGTKPLRVLARSADLPAVGFLTSRGLPESLQQRIGDALVRLKDSPAGRAILVSIRDPASGYRRAAPAEFAPLRGYLSASGLTSGDASLPGRGD